MYHQHLLTAKFKLVARFRFNLRAQIKLTLRIRFSENYVLFISEFKFFHELVDVLLLLIIPVLNLFLFFIRVFRNDSVVISCWAHVWTLFLYLLSRPHCKKCLEPWFAQVRKQTIKLNKRTQKKSNFQFYNNLFLDQSKITIYLLIYVSFTYLYLWTHKLWHQCESTEGQIPASFHDLAAFAFSR